MKTVRFFVVLVGSFLLMRAMSHGEDPKSALANVDIRHHTPPNDRRLGVGLPMSAPILTPSPKTLHNNSLTSIGGPATTSRSTAVINGTRMKRKP